MKSNQKSFTVIELLVVIAIVALLASIVLVSVRGARQRARIAAAKQFSDSIRAGLSYAIVSWWSFDDETASDPWEGNDGTIYGASPADGIIRGALSFNGSGDYVYIDTSSSLSPPGGMSEITLEAWAKSIGNTGNWQVILMKGSMDAEIDIKPETGEFRLGITNTAGSRTVWNISAGITTNKWYHLVMTYDGSLIKGYVNGEFKESQPKTGNVRSSATPNLIGQYINTFWFRGFIDEVRVYNRSFTALEIKKRYAEGLFKKLKLAEK